MTATLADLVQHQLLPRVTKPNRYLGNALHAPRKPLAAAEVTVLMAFPDAYEIGLSNIGLAKADIPALLGVVERYQTYRESNGFIASDVAEWALFRLGALGAEAADALPALERMRRNPRFPYHQAAGKAIEKIRGAVSGAGHLG